MLLLFLSFGFADGLGRSWEGFWWVDIPSESYANAVVFGRFFSSVIMVVLLIRHWDIHVNFSDATNFESLFTKQTLLKFRKNFNCVR